MCPNCIDKKLILQDDSFSHQFGTEIIKFFYCESCDYKIDFGEVENEM